MYSAKKFTKGCTFKLRSIVVKFDKMSNNTNSLEPFAPICIYNLNDWFLNGNFKAALLNKPIFGLDAKRYHSYAGKYCTIEPINPFIKWTLKSLSKPAAWTAFFTLPGRLKVGLTNFFAKNM